MSVPVFKIFSYILVTLIKFKRLFSFLNCILITFLHPFKTSVLLIVVYMYSIYYRTIATSITDHNIFFIIFLKVLMLILFWLFQTWPINLTIQEQVFSGWTVPPDSNETEFISSDQEASPSAVKNNRVVLVPCLHVEVHPCSYFWFCGYFWGSWVSSATTNEFSVRVTKITSRIGVSWNHSLPFYFWPI